MPRRKGAQDDMLLAVWEWSGDLARAERYGLQISLSPTRRPGVFSCRARAIVVVDGKAAGVACQVGAEWPDAEGRELGAFLLWLCMWLDREVAQGPMGPGALS